MKPKRKIFFPLTSRAYYGRMKVLLKELQEHPDIDLQIICTGALLVDRYGEKVLEDLEASGFKIQKKILKKKKKKKKKKKVKRKKKKEKKKKKKKFLKKSKSERI